jgi:hypothetical protein
MSLSVAEQIHRRTPAAARLSLRLSCWDDAIRTVPLLVVHRGETLEEIRFRDQVIGFIRRDEHLFRAFSGERLEQASERGHSLLWDKAAALLVDACGLLRAP